MLGKYGRVLYATFTPSSARTQESDALLSSAITSLVDLFFDERRIEPKKAHQDSAESIRRAWMSRVLPGTTDEAVQELLARRRFVVVEGPPGTGKTDLAVRLLREAYGDRGSVIQFHPGTTYESFIGGLAPRDGGALGFTFHPTPGHLMAAAEVAARTPNKPHLLVIDEINRADLAKVLGEAIFSSSPVTPSERSPSPMSSPGSAGPSSSRPISTSWEP